jgi:HAD superfamily phosphatase (TIGR01668 family)
MRIPSPFHPRTWWNLLLGSAMRPDSRIADISQLDAAKLKSQGIAGLIFDADNTLTHHAVGELYPGIAAAYSQLAGEFATVIFSNCPRERHTQLTTMFPSVVPYGHTKPAPGGFQAALDILELPPEKVAMVGDRALTDVLGGNRAGMYTILVEPFPGSHEPKVLTWMRKLERLRLKMPF